MTPRLFAIGIFSSLISATAPVGFAEQPGDNPAETSTILYEPQTLGPADAPAVITEYASVTCSRCASFHETVFPALKARAEAGDLRIEFHEIVTGPVQVSMAGAQLARCSGEDQYFDVVEDLFDQQFAVLQAAQTRQAKSKLKEIGAANGVSGEQFEACIRDEALFEAIAANGEKASARGVRSTPTLFFNGEPIANADYSVENLTRLIDEANGVATTTEADDE